MELIAHRGGASLGPENSLEAIIASLGAGADGVEVDVRLTSDGALVLTHDPIVEHADGTKVRVSEATLDEVRALGTPTLEEGLEAVPADRLIVIELKGHPWEAGYDPDEPAAHAVSRILVSGGDRRVVISSFNPLALGVVRAEARGTRTAVLTAEAFDLGTNLAAALDGDHEECHVPALLLVEPFVVEAHAAGRRVVAWTVDDPDRLRAFDGWGVDGVICDDPAAARRALG